MRLAIVCLGLLVMVLSGLWFSYWKASRVSSNAPTSRIQTNGQNELALGTQSADTGLPEETERARRSEGPTTSEPATIPPHIQRLLDIRADNGREGYAVMREIIPFLTPSDEPLLLRLYTEREPLTDKLFLTWALAAVGGDESAKALWATVTADYDQFEHPPSNPGHVTPKGVFSDTIRALGALASRSDLAFSRLLEATGEEFWSTHRGYLQIFGDRREVQMTRVPIVSLGWTGRPEVPGILEALRMQSTDILKVIYGSLTSAAFSYDMASKARDHQELMSLVMRGTTQGDYERWGSETENGRAWRAWAGSTRRRP